MLIDHCIEVGNEIYNLIKCHRKRISLYATYEPCFALNNNIVSIDHFLLNVFFDYLIYFVSSQKSKFNTICIDCECVMVRFTHMSLLVVYYYVTGGYVTALPTVVSLPVASVCIACGFISLMLTVTPKQQGFLMSLHPHRSVVSALFEKCFSPYFSSGFNVCSFIKITIQQLYWHK